MNYLAHLFLAQPTPESCFGNLLGDFMRGVRPQDFSQPVRQGLANHRLVDRETDTHAQVLACKALFSPARRRFAGIIVDIVFDHFLIKHWSQFSAVPFDEFCHQRYTLLHQQIPAMPESMQHTVTGMVKHEWLKVYRQLDGVSRALDNTAARIRFRHQFAGSIDEVLQHYTTLESAFLAFFPELAHTVAHQNLEISVSAG